MDSDDVLAPPRYQWHQFAPGFGAALCLASSPIFIRAGLRDLPSPLLGVTVGISVNLLAFGVLMLVRRNIAKTHKAISPNIWLWQLAAGVFVALATWSRWVALDLIRVATVVALGRLAVPVVVVVAPLLVGWQAENITVRMLFGVVLILAGSLLLILYG